MTKEIEKTIGKTSILECPKREDIAREINQYEGHQRKETIVDLVLSAVHKGSTSMLSDLYHLTSILYPETIVPLLLFPSWWIRAPFCLMTHRPNTVARIVPVDLWNAELKYCGVLLENNLRSIELLENELPYPNILMSDFRQLNPYYYLAALLAIANISSKDTDYSDIALAHKDCSILEKICNFLELNDDSTVRKKVRLVFDKIGRAHV